MLPPSRLGHPAEARAESGAALASAPHFPGFYRYDGHEKAQKAQEHLPMERAGEGRLMQPERD